MMNEKFWQNNVSRDEIVYYNACTRNIPNCSTCAS